MGWIERSLTRRIMRKRKDGKQETIIIKPNGVMVWGVKFAMVMVLCLTALEFAHMLIFHAFNGEIFVGITGLTSFVTGILVSHKA